MRTAGVILIAGAAVYGLRHEDRKKETPIASIATEWHLVWNLASTQSENLSIGT
jgi:hypothetical protein